ncbi:amidohydrolase family protein [Dactylosporangium siamense]|uniref:Amidohydrolase n=1 Tax=Dactylosporangium siamense TaxID=685454 RepID=A0A919UG36_9ACTN|nr:amidohydrolase family protein [Dactylosporangium siamense]GIG49258.1 amidohydrolase [Dactylosporangium siamense]
MSAVALTNVRVFDGVKLGDPTTVGVDGGLITAATKHAERVDCHGAALLPGLIDTHVHVTEVAHLRVAARWGVTTMLDMGCWDAGIPGKLKGLPGLPDVRIAGNLANAPGSHFVKHMGFGPSSTVTGPQDATRFVADRVAEGSDYIKIAVEDPKIPGTKALSPETVTAVVEAAHTAGLLTIAHVVSADTLTVAIRAGADIVTHTALTSELDAEFEALLARRQVVIVPTLTMMDGVVRNIGGKLIMRVLGTVIPGMRMRYDHATATVATFRKAGMTVLVGTDSNDNVKTPAQVPYGESIHEELHRLVAAGLSPAEALRGATSAAAGTFGLSDRGVIAPGRRADLLLVGGDPTVDIAATRDIRGVWIGGTRVR